MRLAVFGNFGTQNLGDDLILKGLQESYARHELVVFCGYPERVHAETGLEALYFFPGGLRSWWRYFSSRSYRQQVKQSQEALARVDQVIVGGGGILVDRHLAAIALWWSQLRAIVGSKKPLSFVANSFELNRWWARRLFMPFLQLAQEISVRDSHSLAFVQRLGLKASHREDLAWSIPLLQGEKGAHTPQIAVSLCQWGLSAERLQTLRELLQTLQQEGIQVIGMAFQTLGDDDRKVFRQLDEELEVVEGYEAVMKALDQSQAVIAMRFHAALLSIRKGLPLVALAYQEKVRYLMEDHKRAESCLAMSEVNSAKAQALFQKLIDGVKNRTVRSQ